MSRICHIIPFYEEQYGGSERFVDTLSTYQSAKGFDVIILTTTKCRNRVGREKKNGIEIIKCFSYKDIWNLNPISLILPFPKLDIEILHVHSHLYFTSNQAVFFGRIKKIPSLLHLHGGIGLPPYQTTMLKRTAKAFYDKSIGKFTLKSANKVASVSKNDINKLHKMNILPEEKIVYIPNIVSLDFRAQEEKVRNQDEEFFTILYVGDIEPWKGMNFLIGWIKKTNMTFKKKLKFQFIGQGSFSSLIRKLENSTKKFNKGIIVEYLGQKPHDMIPKYLHKANALILPSFWEGLPTVILEAMLAKTPVIATPVGDIPSLIQHKKNGLLFNLSYKNLNNVINYLLENSGETEAMIENAYKNVINNYTVDPVHKKLLDVYKTL